MKRRSSGSVSRIVTLIARRAGIRSSSFTQRCSTASGVVDDAHTSTATSRPCWPFAHHHHHPHYLPTPQHHLAKPCSERTLLSPRAPSRPLSLLPPSWSPSWSKEPPVLAAFRTLRGELSALRKIATAPSLADRVLHAALSASTSPPVSTTRATARLPQASWTLASSPRRTTGP